MNGLMRCPLRMHGCISPLLHYFFMAWCLVKYGIRIHGVVLKQGQLYFYTLPYLQGNISADNVKLNIDLNV
jgi:hypothetical protein